MFGGPPIMSSPSFIPSAPPQVYPGPRYASQPMSPPAAPPGWAQAAPPGGGYAPPPPPTAPIARGRAEEEPASEAAPQLAPARAEQQSTPEETPREPLRLPSPEELGVDSPAAKSQAVINWTQVHRQLARLGALSFYQQKLPGGGYRVTFLLPAGKEGRAHHVEAIAETDAEAVLLALDRAEKWAGQR